MTLVIEDAQTLVVILMLTFIFLLMLLFTLLTGKSLDPRVRCAFSNAFHKIALSRLRFEGPTFCFQTTASKNKEVTTATFFPRIVQNN